MTITEETVNDITVLHLSGELTYAVRKEVKAAVERTCSGGCRHLVLDIREVPFVDSAILGLLALLAHQFKAMPASLSLLHPQPRVREIFALSNMSRIVPVYERLEDALEAGGVKVAGR